MCTDNLSVIIALLAVSQALFKDPIAPTTLSEYGNNNEKVDWNGDTEKENGDIKLELCESEKYVVWCGLHKTKVIIVQIVMFKTFNVINKCWIISRLINILLYKKTYYAECHL